MDGRILEEDNAMNRHAYTPPAWDKIGQRPCQPYQPTHDFKDEFISQAHASLQAGIWPRGIHGKLHTADMLKLYEMAYFADGNVLEIGCHHGLSTCIMARAIRDSGHDKKLITVDIADEYVDKTSENLRKEGLHGVVLALHGDGLKFIRGVNGSQQFAFAFIDHDHKYVPVRDMCHDLVNVIMAGGFVMFHDFDDGRNKDSGNGDYGVYQGVLDGLNATEFEFWGLYGPSALFRRKEG